MGQVLWRPAKSMEDLGRRLGKIRLIDGYSVGDGRTRIVRRRGVPHAPSSGERVFGNRGICGREPNQRLPGGSMRRSFLFTIGLTLAVSALLLTACGSPSYCVEVGRHARSLSAATGAILDPLENAKPADQQWIDEMAKGLERIDEAVRRLQGITTPEDAVHLQSQFDAVGKKIVQGTRLIRAAARSPVINTKAEFDNSGAAVRGVHLIAAAMRELAAIGGEGGAVHNYCSSK